MSGGSYNYLCYNTYDVSSRRGDVESMAVRLEELGHYEAARSTRNVLIMLQGVDRTADALSDVWREVEWKDSGDGSDEAVDKAVAKFKPWPPEPEVKS